MMKLMPIAVLLATSLWTSQATGQSVLQKADWPGPRFESNLPAPNATVPWFNLDTRTKLPKGDLPIGREAGTVGRLVLRPVTPDTRISSNIPSDFGRM
jgi:hypothetical protein